MLLLLVSVLQMQVETLAKNEGLSYDDAKVLGISAKFLFWNMITVLNKILRSGKLVPINN